MQIPMRATVISEMKKIAAENSIVLAPLIDDDLALADTGLDSLCLAILVARLEDRLGADPFASMDDGEFPVTVADFVQMYERACAASLPRA